MVGPTVRRDHFTSCKPNDSKTRRASSMEASGMSALLYRRSKPLGKVRRRLQDLRIPSSSCRDSIPNRAELDLSHNESARLAVDSLLSRGLEGYHEVLNAEGEVDFLSALEKTYMLENGSDSSTVDPGASDGDTNEAEGLYSGSQFFTQCSTVSTEPDPTGADVKVTDPVLDKPNIEFYWQSDTRAAGMKDLLREFIRKAGMALAIVMDVFSDVELLCDLLEASRKRNVSVHLLLDRLNLNLFVDMWQDLKLDSKSFPKLSVRSVDGQTYCAKTGRKVTGHVMESFIITDWTEVLTGSYSFSWLSWQVHRSLAILIKGPAVTPFHKEFLRLYSSSRPVPGFVTFITVPHTLPLHNTLEGAQRANAGGSGLSPTKTKCHDVWNQDAQNTQPRAKIRLSSNLQRCPPSQPLRRAGSGTQIGEEPLQLYPKPLVQSVGKSKQTMGAVLRRHGAQKDAEPLEVNQTPIQSHSNRLNLTRVSHVQSQLTGLDINATPEQQETARGSRRVRTASPTPGQHWIVTQQSTSTTDLEQRNRTEPRGPAAGPDTERERRTYSNKCVSRVEQVCECPRELTPSTTQQKQASTGLWVPLRDPRGPTAGPQTNASSLGTRRPDHPQIHHQHAGGLPGTDLQQARPPPRLDWMAQSRLERPRPIARYGSFTSTTRRPGQVDLRQFQRSMNTSLGRSMYD
uniref:Scaffolding anchor of CK1 domain-containing protein n=1 Tax=Gasterosteus aculeatus aculeatus TaxID=481459 RepID=A0AAQ4PC43_GASAC|nr:protein FAM83A [Gasterosteus aculeatus aculeatus]XP_040021373.1 protein FAM83A [Gasterosteus aculeatus aculeatus]